MHIGATWRVQLNDPCAAEAVRPDVRLPRRLVRVMQDHSRGRLHERGQQTVQAGGLQQHDPVAGGHHPRHELAVHQLRRQGPRGQSAAQHQRLLSHDLIIIIIII